MKRTAELSFNEYLTDIQNLSNHPMVDAVRTAFNGYVESKDPRALRALNEIIFSIKQYDPLLSKNIEEAFSEYLKSKKDIDTYKDSTKNKNKKIPPHMKPWSERTSNKLLKAQKEDKNKGMTGDIAGGLGHLLNAFGKVSSGVKKIFK